MSLSDQTRGKGEQKLVAELDAWIQVEKWKAIIERDIATGMP
jgi:hypothetical protein